MFLSSSTISQYIDKRGFFLDKGNIGFFPHWLKEKDRGSLTGLVKLSLLGRCFIFSIFTFILFPAMIAIAEEFVFETNTIRYVINSAGLNLSLQEKSTGKDWIGTTPSPFSHVTKSGKAYPVSQLSHDGEGFFAKFGETDIVACYRIEAHKTHITIELKTLNGPTPDSIQLFNINTIAFPNTGHIIAAQWNDHITVCLMALSERVNSDLKGNNTLLSTVYPQLGMVGEKVALIAVPTSAFLDVVQEVEKFYHLPSPTINGQWAKQSSDVDTNYLFSDLSEKTADQIIAYAKLGGFKYVLINCPSWTSSRGSYPINRENFPQGEESLKSTIDKFHAAGIKVGMHMLTSLVNKNDPLVRPKPDARLLKDASTSLAHDIDEAGTSIDATDKLYTFLKNQHHAADVSKFGIDIQIDDEIIHCADIGTITSRSFSGCQRGCRGTEAKPHQAGAPIHRLAQGAGAYLADLTTTLKDEIADRIAEVVNRCGFDMIYFDGGELNKANGPAWYWVAQQQIAIWRRLKRDVLFQGSGINHWLWHVIARGTCDDHAAIATKEYMDHHKIKRLQNYRNNFMPAELGWCGLLSGGFDHLATTEKDMEHYGVRMIAFNCPISIQTSLKKLQSNEQTDSILRNLSQIDDLRRSGRIAESHREQLRTGNWSLFDAAGNVALKPVKRQGHQNTGLRSQTKSKTLNEGEPGTVRHFPSTSYVKARLLFQGDKLLACPAQKERKFRPGALICSVYFTDAEATKVQCVNPLNPPRNEHPKVRYLDLRQHQVLAVTLSVEGRREDVNSAYPVLNVQLEDDRFQFRDHYVDLDFTGKKTVIIPRTNVERLLLEFKNPRYNTKKAVRYFNYSKVAALHFRWMRPPESPSLTYYTHTVKALNR